MAIRKRDERLAPAGYWSPSSILEEMERMFDDFRLGFGDMPMRLPSTRLPAVDIRDEGNQYVVEAEIPGMRKEEVIIEVGEEALTIKAERESNIEEEKEGYVRRERGHMSFYRQVPLPMDAESSTAEARMEDGLLKVTLPKKAKEIESKRKLEIQ